MSVDDRETAETEGPFADRSRCGGRGRGDVRHQLMHKYGMSNRPRTNSCRTDAGVTAVTRDTPRRHVTLCRDSLGVAERQS